LRENVGSNDIGEPEARDSGLSNAYGGTGTLLLWSSIIIIVFTVFIISTYYYNWMDPFLCSLC